MTNIKLSAAKRTVTGRKVKKLREAGLIPANIYGKDVKSISIEVKVKEFKEVFKKAGETGIVEITVGKETRPVLVHNVQVHPATDEVLHVDFHQVNLKEKATAQIPLELVGESPAEKSGEGTVVLLMQELEVEALPSDIPSKFEIDASKLTEVDQTVKISDLDFDKGKVEFKLDVESIVAKVEPPQKEEVVEETPIETETTVQGTGEETPAAEGEAKADAPAEESKA